MALQEVKCVCGEILMRDDWDGQYYQEDCNGLWNKVWPVEEDDNMFCSQDCYNDYHKKGSDRDYMDLVDSQYQEYKDGERSLRSIRGF
jgi:hypothetical protein